MNIIFVLVLLAVAGWFLWSSWDKEAGTFDFKKGLAGIAAAAAGLWGWFTDFGGFGGAGTGM